MVRGILWFFIDHWSKVWFLGPSLGLNVSLFGGQEFPLTWRKKFVFWDSKEQREEGWVGTIRRDVSSPWRNLLQISVRDKMDLPVGFGKFSDSGRSWMRPAGSRQFNSEVPTSFVKPDSFDLKEWVNLCFAGSVHLKFFTLHTHIYDSFEI